FHRNLTSVPSCPAPPDRIVKRRKDTKQGNALMKRKLQTLRAHSLTASRLILELPPDRAFVVHLDASARPPHQLLGRVEHITSGRVAHVASLHELVEFLAQMLRERVQDE